MVGYSRLVAADDEGTIRRLKALREIVDALIASHHGRVFSSAGDSVIAEFPSAVAAVRCAVEIQDTLARRDSGSPEATRMRLRIGVNLGDVVFEGDNLLGDGVNIAARLESLADPGGIFISASVHEQVRNRIDRGLEDLGARSLKIIPRPVGVFRVDIDGLGSNNARWRRGARTLTKVLISAAGAALLGAAALWLSWPRPLGLLLDVSGLSTVTTNPPLPDKPSVVVLPFANLSEEPEQEHFADGMTEDLITDLSQNPSLFVISRSSAFSYKGTPVKIDDVARELGVRYVVEGSVRKAGDRMRITVQLIDATTGFHVWSERYDRRLPDLFAVQDEVSQRILKELVGEIRDEEMMRRRHRTDSLQAYEAFQRGISHFEHFTRSHNLEARRWYRRATEIDPQFAEAHAILGNTYVTEYTFMWKVDPALLDIAEEHRTRALEIDPRSLDAHLVASNVARERDRLDEALTWAERAIELEPNLDVPYLLRGLSLVRGGRPFEALDSINLGLRLNPRGPNTAGLLGMINYFVGREEEAVKLLELSRAANTDQIPARLVLAAHYQSVGREAEARAIIAEVRRVNPELTLKQVKQTSPGRAMDEVFDLDKQLRAAGLS